MIKKILYFFVFHYYRILYDAIERQYKKNGYLSTSENNIYQDTWTHYLYYANKLNKKIKKRRLI